MKTIIYWFLLTEAASASGRAPYQQNRASRRCVLLADTPQLDPYQPMHITLNCHQFCMHEWEEALWLISCCYCYQLRLDGMVCLWQGWQRGGWRAVVFVRVCMFFYVLGDGGGSFSRCNSSSQRFPTLLFSTDVHLCSCVSSHVVISAPFWRCGTTTQQYFPPQSMPETLLIPSLRFLLLRVGLHVAMFSFQTLYIHAKKPSLPTRRADDGLKWTRCFLGVMSRPIWISYISSSVSVASRGSKQPLLTCTKRATGFWLHLWRLSGHRCLTLRRGVVRFAQTDVRVPETMC